MCGPRAAAYGKELTRGALFSWYVYMAARRRTRSCAMVLSGRRHRQICARAFADWKEELLVRGSELAHSVVSAQRVIRALEYRFHISRLVQRSAGALATRFAVRISYNFAASSHKAVRRRGAFPDLGVVCER